MPRRFLRTAVDRPIPPYVLLPLLVLAGPAAAVEAGAGPATTTDGVYTRKQARAGQAVHEQHCAGCHDRGYYTGAFLDAWRNVPVSTLYDVIELKMPEDAPGSLSPREYAALLAWIFELNGLPTGEVPLPHDRADMANILIAPE